MVRVNRSVRCPAVTGSCKECAVNSNHRRNRHNGFNGTR